MNVAITGATGFIGKRVVSKALQRKINLTILVRNNHDLDWKSSHQLHIKNCDYSDIDSLSSALSKVDVVIHLAADMRSERMYESTISLTANLLTAMDNSSVKRLVLCSSISVLDYASATACGTIDETTAICKNDNSLGTYAKMKRDQEILAKQWASDGKSALILRPGLVYADDRMYGDHIGFTKKGISLISHHTGEIPLVHVDSVADALCAAVDSRPHPDNVFHIIDNTLPCQPDYVKTLKARGEFSFGLKIHWKAYRAITGFIRFLFHVTSLKEKTPDSFRKNSVLGRTTPFQFSNLHAQKSLNWTPMQVNIK